MFGGSFSQLLNFLQTTERYRKTMNSGDIETLQLDLDRVGSGR